MNGEPGFRAIQTQTGWGAVLQSFAAWIDPQPGWVCLDVGCGPGLLPKHLAQAGLAATGIDRDYRQFLPRPLHPRAVCGDALQLPFKQHSFNLVSAVNVLFLLPDAAPALSEIRRVLRPDGRLGMLNPSEQMSLAAVEHLITARGLDGLAAASLRTWARNAEAGQRWDESAIQRQLAHAGFRVERQTLRVGPGLARMVCAQAA